jgi:plasmid stability protein
MPTVAIALDQQLLQSIELRGEALGLSAEQNVAELLKIGLLNDPRGRSAVAARIRSLQERPLTEDSTDLIRRLRDGDR